MHLFTAAAKPGEASECDEGILKWVDIQEVPSLPLWDGDRVFLKLLCEDAPFFLLKLIYEGDTLVAAGTDSLESYVARAMKSNATTNAWLLEVLDFTDSAYAYTHK